jgi:hypothetical protein
MNRLATVISIDGSGLTLRFDGETEARTKKYKRLASYTPSVGDRVFVVFISGTYIVMGKVI